MTATEYAIRHALIAVECDRLSAQGAPAAIARTAELHRQASARIMTAEVAEIEARKDRLRRAFRGDWSGYRQAD